MQEDRMTDAKTFNKQVGMRVHARVQGDQRVLPLKAVCNPPLRATTLSCHGSPLPEGQGIGTRGITNVIKDQTFAITILLHRSTYACLHATQLSDARISGDGLVPSPALMSVLPITTPIYHSKL
jgi:hypothetical protein